MKVSGICLVILTCAVLLVSGVSAQNVDKTAGYNITPAGNLFLPAVVMPMSTNTISQGQTRLYSNYVSPGTTTLYVDVNWGGDTATSLTLTIITPDATLGPYTDSSDGIVNGRIYLSISKPSGLPSGTWKFKIYGQSVTGVKSYTFTAQ